MFLLDNCGNFLYLAVPLLAWMIFEAVWDWRDQDLPVLLSFVPLVILLIYRGIETPLVAILMAISVFSTELPHTTQYFFVVASAFTVFVFDPLYLPLVAGWLILYVFWLLDWVGGADALAVANLLLAFPDWAMLISIGVGILVWGVALLAMRYGRNSILRLWVVFTTKVSCERRPGMGAYAVAMCIFMAWGIS